MIEAGQGTPKGEMGGEQNKEYGKNVTVHAIFARHGEKGLSTTSGETPLSLEGKIASIAQGRGLQDRTAIKSYSSDTERTIKTADFVVAGSPTAKKMLRRLRPELAFHYDHEGAFVEEAMRIKQEVFGDDYEQQDSEEQLRRMHESDNRQIDYYLGHDDQRPDPNTYSPVETAALMADRLQTYIDVSDKMYTNSDVDLLNSTHDFNLAAFLKEVMIREIDERQVRGFDSIRDIGGSMQFNESFEVTIQLDEQGKKSFKLLLRGEEYEIDTERLDELVKIAQGLK